MSEENITPEPTFWGWVSTLDPALSGYTNRAHHSPDEHYAFLMGQWAGGWAAIWEMSKYRERGIDPEQLLAMFTHVQKALLRRRTPLDFRLSLEHHAQESPEWREHVILEAEKQIAEMDAELEAALRECADPWFNEHFPGGPSVEPDTQSPPNPQSNDSSNDEGETR